MTYRFDDFQLNLATRELRLGASVVPLPARAFECLAYLIEHRERAVGRDELTAAVWGRTEVSDALLNHTVVKIRRSLGDTGNQQRTIRTVPRFGYRWVGEIEAAPESGAPESTVRSITRTVLATDTPISEAHSAAIELPVSQPRRFSAFVLLALVSIAVIAIGIAIVAHRPTPPAAPSANTKVEAGEEAIVAPALVLPAEVTAPDEWRWLRFGLMDLIANRLRDNALHTMSSESVVGILKQRGTPAGNDLLHDSTLANVAALRVLPRVRVDGNHWTVRLDAYGAQVDLSVEARADDAIKAARDAADLLLLKLGRKLNVAGMESQSPELEELMQRSGAAMLADQLDQARDMIRAAPPQLQQQPRVEQRMAQIELRFGDYPATEKRLQALLDKLSPKRDSALRARAAITLAVAYLHENKLDQASEMYEEAIRLRERQSDPEVLGVAYLGRGAVLAQKSQFDEAISEMSRARIELETVGDGRGVASVDVNLGEFQAMRHRPAEALPMLKNSAREFAQLSVREGLAHALELQAGVEREMLDFAAALATTERFLPPESHTSNVRLRWTLLCARAEALADVARRDEAQALIVRIRTESDPHADAVARARAEALAAALAWRGGDAGAAARLAGDALTPALRDEEPALYTRTAVKRVQALLRDGRTDEAAAQLQAIQTWIGSDDAIGWRGMYANLGAAELDWFAGRREPALERFAAALQRSTQFNVPEDLVAVAVPDLDALIQASQLDSARMVAGRIAAFADRDVRVATAQARLFRALHQDDAARRAEETAAALQRAPPPPPPAKTP
jgi:DNA-binding winged helix-turn-helix (wHTH) protein/tetratricopeptide (TPR) repeat protein